MPGKTHFHRFYAIFFSLAYAIFHVFCFYPGILYSDSAGRWRLAIALSADGVSAFSDSSNQHPLLPSFVLSAFYSITSEIGLYIFFQVFAFALSLFIFAYTYQRGVTISLLVSVALLAPINRVYGLFHSYDSIAAIVLILLAASTVRLYRGDYRQLYFLPILKV